MKMDFPPSLLSEFKTTSIRRQGRLPLTRSSKYIATIVYVQQKLHKGLSDVVTSGRKRRRGNLSFPLVRLGSSRCLRDKPCGMGFALIRRPENTVRGTRKS